MSDGIFHRSRRLFEPRTRDERSRELGEKEIRTPDQGATERPDPGADALLELARLIGQPDSFASTPGGANEGRSREASPTGRLADVGRGAPDIGAEDLSPRPKPRYPAQPQDRSYEVRLHEPRLFENRSFEDRSSSDEAARDRRSDNFDFLELSGRDEYPVAPGQGRADDRDYDHGDHHEDLRMGQRHAAYPEHDEYADEYGEDAHGQDDDDYETEHPEDESEFKPRSTTKVVIAVLGLAVFGSAAAFGYRTVFGGGPSGPTPIIRADYSPTKVMPAATDANQASVGERPGDSSSERLVRRDEDPVDVGASYRSAPSSDVGSPAPAPDMAGSPPATVPPSGSPGSSNDARRVRTVPIRVDQGPAPPDRPAATAARPTPPPTAPTPPRQVAALPPPTPSAPPAAAAPAVAASFPARATEAGAGGFVVQISAQRSEAEAQAAFRAMQAKYAALNGHELIIKRKDQGDRGIFYAAQVGPFGAKSEADQLCETLKSAGGTCFVQRN
jgi:SPOR domain